MKGKSVIGQTSLVHKASLKKQSKTFCQSYFSSASTLLCFPLICSNMSNPNHKSSIFKKHQPLPTSRKQLKPRSLYAHGPRASDKSISDKLQALQSLIPTQEPTNDNNEIQVDKLFRETADYIILLETRVSILRGLIQFYGSAEESEECF